MTALLGLGTTRLRAGVTAAVAAILFFAAAGIISADRLGSRAQEARREIQWRTALTENLIKQALLLPGHLLAAQLAPIPVARLEESVLSAFQTHAMISKLEFDPAGHANVSFSRSDLATTVLAATELAKMTGAGGEFERLGQANFFLENATLVAIQPMQIRHGASPPDYWGDVKATLGVADVVRLLRFDDWVAQGNSVSLEYFPRDATTGKALLSMGGAGTGDWLDGEILLPKGARLLLRLSLPAKWSVSPGSWAELVLLFVGGVALGWLTYLGLRRPLEVRQQIAMHTSQLVMDKEMLETELERCANTELQLQQSHALLSSIFEHIPSMIVLKRVSDMTVVRVNRLGELILGQSKAALLGRSNKELFQGEQAQRDAETDLKAVHEKNLIELPEQFIQAPGGFGRWIKIKKLALFDTDGKPSHVLEIGEDVTVHKHLDAALTENLNFVEQLLAAIPLPIFFKDVNGTYMGVNRAFEQFYGTTSAAIVGTTASDMAPSRFAETEDKVDRDLLDNGGTRAYDARIKCADGKEKDVVFFKALFSTTHAEVGGVVGIILDVTQQKAAERHILRLNRTLAVVSEANKAILKSVDCRNLIQDTVDILHNVGGFPLAWVYASAKDLPALLVVGEHAELVARLTQALRTDARDPSADAPGNEAGRSRFFASLLACDPTQEVSYPEFELHGVAHLPLRVAGELVGGICIVGLAEDLEDIEEQELLGSLAENLSRAIDALEQESARQIAERNLELASHVFENSAEGVMITDKANRILMVNRRFSEITGYTAEEVIGNMPNMLSSGQQDQSFYSNMWRALTNRGEWHGEIRNRRKDGEVIVEWMNISAVRNEAGEIINYVAVSSEITVHKTIKKRMQFLAHYDALTSLPNRILFSDRFEQSIIAARQSKRCVALMLIDLDHFDLINKSAGHAAGDLLLQEVSARLLRSVPPGSCVARLGGDEFAIALSDIGSGDEAAVTANGLQQELGRAFYVESTELYVSASIGISVYPKDGEDAEALTKSADAAMYLAAEAGGNTYRFPQANERLSDIVMLRDRLQRAIEQDELKVFYQPLVSGETGQIVGAEALLRWFRPETGYVSPESFVPMLEEAGLAVKVGDWVLRTALAANLGWRRDFDSELFVAVNLCAEQIADEKAVEKVAAVMRTLNFDPRYLCLEISEGTLMQDAPKGLALLHGLKDLKVGLTMDNFGTGYSSLSYLNRFPIDSLKIDRTFVQDVPNDADAVAIIRTIIAIGHALNLKIVAAGVETAGQVEFLRLGRCDLLQGYRFSRGLVAEEFALLLAGNKTPNSLFSALNASDQSTAD